MTCRVECREQVLALAKRYLEIWAENGLRGKFDKNTPEDMQKGAIRKAAEDYFHESTKKVAERINGNHECSERARLVASPLDERSELFKSWMRDPLEIYSS